MKQAMNETLNAVFGRVQRIALIVGVVGLALCGIGLLIDSTQALQSYLFAFVYWVGMSLGCLAVLMIQYTVKGAWGRSIRRFLEAGAMTLPLLAILFIPIALGLGVLYPWAHSELVTHDLFTELTGRALSHNSTYLNAGFFIIRAIIYFAVWSAFAYLLRYWSLRQDTERNTGIFQRLQNLSIFGAIMLALTITFAMIDWIMSLEPEWSSTIYAAMVAMGGLLAGFALVVALVTRLRAYEPFSDVVTPALLNDLGNLLMAALLMWAYLSFSQYLVIWTGNLSEEIPWYLRRLDGGWQAVALTIVVLNFAVPFALLLSPQVKRNARLLGLIAALILVMQLVNAFWLVVPALRLNGLAFTWTDLAAPIGIGGLWVAMFLRTLHQSPLLPTNENIEARPHIQTQEVVTNG